jgi:hypothetical protein
MSPETIESLRSIDIAMEKFRAVSRKKSEENKKIIRHQAQRMADILEEGRLSDIRFAEEMKNHQDMFNACLIHSSPRR